MRLTGFIRSQNQNVITPPLTETDGDLTNHFHSLLKFQRQVQSRADCSTDTDTTDYTEVSLLQIAT